MHFENLRHLEVLSRAGNMDHLIFGKRTRDDTNVAELLYKRIDVSFKHARDQRGVVIRVQVERLTVGTNAVSTELVGRRRAQTKAGE